VSHSWGAGRVEPDRYVREGVIRPVFKLSQGMEIERPAEIVWPYLAALEQVPLWEHGILDVKQVDPGPLCVGMRFTAGRIYAGRATPLDGDVRIVEEGHSMTAALRGGPHVESLVTYAVEALGPDRCRVTYSATGRLRFPLSLLDPLFPAIGRAETRKNLARLRRRILAGIPPTANTPTPG